MPEARASRKRQIQVTPGPFSDAAASSAYLTANRVQAGSLSSFSKVFPAFFYFSAFREPSPKALQFSALHAMEILPNGTVARAAEPLMQSLYYRRDYATRRRLSRRHFANESSSSLHCARNRTN
jgi:hypothetical protein